MYTIKETAEKLRISTKTVYRLIDSGKLDHIRISTRKIMISENQINQYLQNCTRIAQITLIPA